MSGARSRIGTDKWYPALAMVANDTTNFFYVCIVCRASYSLNSRSIQTDRDGDIDNNLYFGTSQ